MQDAKNRKGENHRGQAHTNGDAGLADDIQRGGREHAPQKKTRQRRAKRELRHLAAKDIREPPLVFLRARPVSDLLVAQVLDCHGSSVGTLLLELLRETIII